TLKMIDCWVGIPICFILSSINAIKRFFVSKHYTEYHPRKIMFLELSEMGSAILGYPAMRKAQALRPSCLLYLWIFKKNKDIAPLLGIFPDENIVTMRDDNFFYLVIDIIRNLRKVRKEKIDVIIDMELFSRVTSLLSYFSGAKIKVGFYGFSIKNPYRGELHTHKVNYSCHRHMRDNFLALVEPLTMFFKEYSSSSAALSEASYLPKRKLGLYAPRTLWQKLEAYNNHITKNSKIIILHPGVCDVIPIRAWPLQNYIELMRRLLINTEIFFIVIGMKLQPSDARMLEREMRHPRCAHLVGQTTIKELIDLFTISHLFISHDSGAVHLASLTEINIIALFGPEAPLLYKPLSDKSIILYKDFACSPCLSAYNYRSSACKDNICLRAITVDEVYNQAVRALGLFTACEAGLREF
ncbi:MAG: hypothetical protein A2460_02045, partial [Omnitrophica WOR_2 bacterium RIFOXYC2_FULL_43_9]